MLGAFNYLLKAPSITSVMILLIEVQMWELTEFVIPKVKDKWEHLAYRMRYKVGEVQAFKIDSQDVKDCCSVIGLPPVMVLCPNCTKPYYIILRKLMILLLRQKKLRGI